MLYVVVTLVLTWLVLRNAWFRFRYDLHKIPSPPKTPFLGHTLHLWNVNSRNFVVFWIREWHKKLGYPKVLLLSFFGRCSVQVMDMDLLREVVSTSPHPPPRGGPAVAKLRRLVSGDDPIPSIIGLDGNNPYIKAVRRAHLSSFTTTGLKQIFPRQKIVMKKFIDQIDKQRAIENQESIGDRDVMGDGNMIRSIEVQDLCVRAAIDHIGRVGFDLDLGGLEETSPLHRLLVRCVEHAQFQTPSLIEALRKHLSFLESTKQMNRDFDALFEKWNEVAAAVMSRGEPEMDDLSLWASLRRVRLPDSDDRLPFNLMRGEIATAIIGGTDTTGHQLAWIIALLATHPDVVTKLLSELEGRGLDDERCHEIEFEDLGELEYLGAVVKEAMRRIHVTPFISIKKFDRDAMINGYRIPKGTVLGIPGGIVMNNESQWKDHLEFKPERWLENKDYSSSFYAPFSIGERSCVGARLAMQFLKLAIVFLVRKYKLELIGSTVEELINDSTTGLVLSAPNGINIKFHSTHKQLNLIYQSTEI